MKLPYEEFDLAALHTYPLKSRAGKARAEDFGAPYRAGGGAAGLLGSIPDILAGADLRRLVAALREARARECPIIWGLGAHVIKVGLSPLIIDLMARGYVSALAFNGAGVIHDFEMALVGQTSEEVAETLQTGQFGMAEETGRLLNEAIASGVARGLGIGQAVGRYLTEVHPQFERVSLIAQAFREDVPVTVHVAIGTDVTHMHPSASGAAIGEGSLRDFRYFVSNVSRLRGGVYLNVGSAVILPEVFLKAVSLSRNRGASLEGLTTANFDFIRHYRPQVNVLTRPTAGTGAWLSFTGHHELLIPLLAAALIEADAPA